MCGACTGQSKDDGGKDTPKEFIPTSWNGEFLKAISDAYETFSETDEMPVSVNVEGITYSQAKYFSAACGILDLIEAYPDTWQERPDVEIPKYSAGGVMQWNTFEQDEISLDAVKWMIGRMREYASGKGMYPNYCSFGTRTWKDDRSGDSTVELNYKSDKEEYVGNIVFRQALVVMSRIMNHYKNNLMLPEKTSSWWSGFLGSTSNCPVDDPLVLSTMKEAISGKVTAREKPKPYSLMPEIIGLGKTITTPKGGSRNHQRQRRKLLRHGSRDHRNEPRRRSAGKVYSWSMLFLQICHRTCHS